MQPVTHVFPNSVLLAHYLGQQLIDLCQTKDCIYVALSGGSTPKQIFEEWSKSFAQTICWSKMKLFWGDERYVPPTHEMSNFAMTQQAMLNHVPVPLQNIFRVKTELPIQDALADYLNMLEHEVPQRNGLPLFDLMFLGLGDDGHTASIFPHEMHLWDWPHPCAIATHPSGQKRISFTGGVINNADRIFFLATGENKKEKVREIIHQKGNFRNLPASRVRTNQTEWLLDQAAAGLLDCE